MLVCKAVLCLCCAFVNKFMHLCVLVNNLTCILSLTCVLCDHD